MNNYIKIGRLDKKLLKKLDIEIVTDEVVFTFERKEHVENKRLQLYEEIKEMLPLAIYRPDYIYKDWNNRDDTLVFIKTIDDRNKLDIVIKIAIMNDEKHPKNSIITMMKIGEKTYNKIKRNKTENLLFEKLDKNE